MSGARVIRRRKNPVGELPYNEWVPTHAVKFNDDGTVDVMTEGGGHHNAGMVQNVTSEEVQAGARVLIAVTQAIHEAGEIPSGHLYAMLSGRMSLQTYESMIRTLLGTGLVEKHGDLLRWVGPAMNPIANIQGYKDASGFFHPIRWDSDYDPEEAGEPRDYVISPSRKFYQMSGETPPRSRKRKRR